jgi:GTP-dependent phosphoenolpyruvate carboxykinase
VPAKNALDTAGVHIDDADLALPLSGDTELGQQEATSIHHHLTTFGNHLPKELPEQHYQLLDRRIGSTGPSVCRPCHAMLSDDVTAVETARHAF